MTIAPVSATASPNLSDLVRGSPTCARTRAPSEVVNSGRRGGRMARSSDSRSNGVSGLRLRTLTLLLPPGGSNPHTLSDRARGPLAHALELRTEPVERPVEGNLDRVRGHSEHVTHLACC